MPSAIQSTSPAGVHIARSGSGAGAKQGQRTALLLFAVAYVAALVVVFAPQGTFAVQSGSSVGGDAAQLDSDQP